MNGTGRAGDAGRFDCSIVLCSNRLRYTNSSVSEGDNHLLQPHAFFKPLWCLQHLASKGAEMLKTLWHARSLDLWTHLPQLRISWHSLNLLSDLASGRLHIAHCWLKIVYDLFPVSTRPGCSGCPAAGARPWPPLLSGASFRDVEERRASDRPRPAAGEAGSPQPSGPGRGRICTSGRCAVGGTVCNGGTGGVGAGATGAVGV